jgi:hypothetical protein
MVKALSSVMWDEALRGFILHKEAGCSATMAHWYKPAAQTSFFGTVAGYLPQFFHQTPPQRNRESLQEFSSFHRIILCVEQEVRKQK